MKESFYFAHDHNAFKDPKIQAMVSDCGIGAYGLYWMLMEVLHEQGGKIEKFPKLYRGLSYDFRCTEEEISKLIEAMLHDYELLHEDEKYIWSNRVLKNLEERRAKRMIKVGAGRLGGLQSGITRRKQTKQNEAVLEANEPKERKGKEKKRKEISKDITTKVEFGNPEINKTLEGLKTIIGIDDFKETQTWQRRYGKHFLLLIKKLGKEEFRRRLAGILGEPFKAKNCNSLKYLYSEMKSFARVGSVASTDMPKFESI